MIATLLTQDDVQLSFAFWSVIVVVVVLYMRVAFSDPGYVSAEATEAYAIEDDIEQMKKYQDRSKQVQ